MHTIMLLDNHEMVRQGIELGLRKEPDLEVIGSFGTSRELLDALGQQPADVVVMDFTLGPSDIDGLGLIQMLGRRFKRCKVLVVSSRCTRATVILALKAGSFGVLGKTEHLTELIVAIRTVAQGRIYLQRCMLSVLREGESVLARENIKSTLENALPVRLSGALTPREQEVLRCFLDGMSVNSIAAKFSRSASTISTQKQSAYRKLGIRTDSELFMFTKQFGRPD
ncbi:MULTISPECIES: response regulator transcription factor [Pseudomonas]|jgi:DNA-binding NarL/FixJ family response regulator|uniref:DNA-binding response regulator, NarL/FixJ family, contains REC and HTH domains n=2 Tax=Pseudomonas extremorientalis TaxID=169669 RepID=A0ABY0STE8_9PSED|nr:MULTISPECIES: response regulator transcription factor [Pseudomonas]UUN89204.1 response regulator transcription factor [Pseudomonas extremorientalis]WLG57302.1 response regulator transcription factor [Pseudomonas extremorientalis]SDP58588.1 DNA-binding response regulator, NarL/FixJ family, contains REC and HTH domains [Pseudomonas extremorientalis]